MHSYEHVMHSMNDEADEVIEKLFKLFKQRYQINLEKIEGRDFSLIMFIYCVINVIE